MFKITEVGSIKKKKKGKYIYLPKFNKPVTISHKSNTHHDKEIAILDFGISDQSLHSKISRIDNHFAKIKLN